MNRIAAALLALSGFSALTYEVAWVRALGWSFGSTAATVAAVTSTFLLGLALGGAAFGRVGDRSRRPWWLFGTIEIAVALYGFASPWLLMAVDRAQAAPSGALLLTALFVLPPTLGLGASVPILASAAVRQGGGYGRTGGRLYAVNTLGGILGVVAAGFWMLESLGVTSTLQVAASGNLLAGLIAWLVGRRVVPTKAEAAPPVSEEEGEPSSRLFVVGLIVAGSVSLGWEVLWTRLLAQFLRNSVYSFAATLAVYLLGITLGSALGARLARRGARAIAIALPAAVSVLGLAGLLLTHRLAEWARLPAAVTPRIAHTLGFTTAHFAGVALAEACLAALLVLPPALLLGVLYPAFLQRNWRGRSRFGSFYGDVTLVHTLGALGGALTTGFVLLPLLGLTRTTLAVAALGGLASLLFLLEARPLRHRVAFGVFALLLLIGGGLVLTLPEGGVRFWRARESDAELVAYEEDALASVAVVRDEGDNLSLRLNATGILGGSASVLIESRQGLLARLLHEAPRNALSLGVGAGNSAAALLQAGVEHVDAVEVVPSVLELLPHFAKTNRNLHEREDVRLVLDDGRSFLRRTEQTYDLILGDLFYPWLAEAGYLYTREHFEAVREHLSESGVFVQWLPLHQLSWPALAIVARTFLEVFGDSTAAWIAGADLPVPILALVGRRRLVPGIELRTVTSAFAQPRLARLLAANGWPGPGDVLANLWADAPALRERFGDAPLNTADRPIVEYLAARRLVSDQETGRRAFVQLSRHLAPFPNDIPLMALRVSERTRLAAARELIVANGGRVSTEREDWVRAAAAYRRGLLADASYGPLLRNALLFGWQLLAGEEPELVLELIPEDDAVRAALPPIWNVLEGAARAELGEAERALELISAYEPGGMRDRGRQLAWLGVAQLLSEQGEAARRSLAEAAGLPGELPRTAQAAQAILEGEEKRARELLAGHPIEERWLSLMSELQR